MRRPDLRRPGLHCLPTLEVLEDRSLLSSTPVGELYAAGLGDGSSVASGPQIASAWRPNDPRYSEQWDFTNTGQRGGVIGADINAEQAWNVTTGSMRTVVAVLDSGVDYTHPDLYLNIWLNQGEIPASRRANLADVDGDGLITFRDLNDRRNQGAGKITDLNGNGRIDGGDVLRPMVKDASGRDTGTGGWANGISDDRDRWVDDLIGWNFSNNTNNPKDDFGHGTHVAGTVAAVGNNGVGVTGVAWKSQLMPVRFFNGSGQATPDQYIAALEYSLAKGVKISVNSFTLGGYDLNVQLAVKKAEVAGQVFVAASGNYGRNSDLAPTYPASFGYDNVVAVAATDRKDQLTPWSNYGQKTTDIAAPGVDVLSTNIGGYGVRSGTSMAAPHVAGVVALVWSLRPEWNYRQVINHVLGSAEDLPSLRGKVGHGRLDAAAAVRVPPRNGPQPSGDRINGWTPTGGGASPASLSPAEFTPPGPLLLSPATGAVPRPAEAPRAASRPADLYVAVPPGESRAQSDQRLAPHPTSLPPVDWLFVADPDLRDVREARADGEGPDSVWADDREGEDELDGVWSA